MYSRVDYITQIGVCGKNAVVCYEQFSNAHERTALERKC